jgi:hypothetical protein
MNKFAFTKEELIEEYKKELDVYLDVCDWVTHVDGYTICEIISGIYSKNGFDVDFELLYSYYNDKVDSLGLSDEEWRKEYGTWDEGMPKIISMIHEIIENNF